MIRKGSHAAKLFTRQQGRCCWCGESVGDLTASIEHIIPRSFGYKNGGTSHYDNKALAHRECNTARSSDITKEPHPDRIFDFVRQRLIAARRFYVAKVAAPLVDRKPKPIPPALRIDWSCIILRRTPDGWTGMAGNMRKSGRANVLRVTPPYINRFIALSDIAGAIR